MLRAQFISTLNTAKIKINPGQAIWAKIFSKTLVNVSLLESWQVRIGVIVSHVTAPVLGHKLPVIQRICMWRAIHKDVEFYWEYQQAYFFFTHDTKNFTNQRL